jgi:hypothetical protein
MPAFPFTALVSKLAKGIIEMRPITYADLP